MGKNKTEFGEKWDFIGPMLLFCTLDSTPRLSSFFPPTHILLHSHFSPPPFAYYLCISKIEKFTCTQHPHMLISTLTLLQPPPLSPPLCSSCGSSGNTVWRKLRALDVTALFPHFTWIHKLYTLTNSVGVIVVLVVDVLICHIYSPLLKSKTHTSILSVLNIE